VGELAHLTQFVLLHYLGKSWIATFMLLYSSCIVVLIQQELVAA